MNTPLPDFAPAQQQATGDALRFSAEGSLLGIAVAAASSAQDVQIALPGNGNLIIFPKHRQYTCDASDMTAFCQAPAEHFDVSSLDSRALAAVEIPGATRPLDELFWQAAFHLSRGRLLRGKDADNLQPSDFVSFKRWPNLTRLPATPNTMRICALLTRNRSPIMLIPRKLRITQEEVFQVVSAAHASGILQIGHDVPGDGKPADPASELEPALADSPVLRAMRNWLAAR